MTHSVKSSATAPHTSPAENLGAWALITGASSGLGREFALLAAASGLTPVLCARRESALKETAAIVKQQTGRGAVIRPADLSEPEVVRRLADELLEAHGAPAVLVNNAGFGAFRPILDEDDALCERMIALNALAPILLAQRMGRAMRSQGGGRILNVASTAAFQPCPNLGVYGATKAFLLSASEAMSEELRGTGVTVTALCPGPTRTNFGTAAGLEADSPFDRYAADAATVARFGWRAMMAGKPVAVEGALNAFVAVVAQLAPRTLTRRIAGLLLAKMK